MSEKCWLIRTRSKQILGPASLEKIISLLEKNTLKEEDEISCGNGYWFWVKEKELVEKYIYKANKQKFDPISEAKSVIAPLEKGPKLQHEERRKVDAHAIQDEQVIPSDEDLEFPDVGHSDPKEEAVNDLELDDVTIIAAHDSIKACDSETKSTSQQLKIDNTRNEVLRESRKLSQKNARAKKKGLKKEVPVRKGSDRYLFILLIFLAVLAIGVIFYFKKVLNKPVPLFSMIPTFSVYAQTTPSLVKKKAS